MFHLFSLFFLLLTPFIIFCEIATVTLSTPSYQSETIPPEIKSPSSFVVMEPVTNKITWDFYVSPYAGGQDLLFAHKILERSEIWMLSDRVYKKTSYARAWRLGELIAIWLPVNYFTMVLQHEVFGHGYRIREFNPHYLAYIDKFEFGVPPPYGPGGGATFYFLSNLMTTSEESAISIGGVEGTAILAQLTKLKWLESGKIDPRQSILYLLSQQDLTLYVGSLSSEEQLDGHDMDSYIKTLNYTYPDKLLTTKQLKNLSWINLADPFTFYSIFAWFHYLSSGKETKIPMIASMYLPGLRLGLTPFGPEVFFENYFFKKKSPIYAYIKAGQHAKNNYFGLGVYAPNIYSIWKWSFGVRADAWRQPKLLLEQGSTSFFDIDFNETPSTDNPLYSSEERHAMRFGAAGSLISTYQATKVCGYEIELGYKSKGFLPGYSLWAFPTVRLNFNFVF